MGTNLVVATFEYCFGCAVLCLAGGEGINEGERNNKTELIEASNRRQNMINVLNGGPKTFTIKRFFWSTMFAA